MAATKGATRARSNGQKLGDEFAELIHLFSRFVHTATELADDPPDRLGLSEGVRQDMSLAANAATQAMTDLAMAFGRQLPTSGPGLDR